MYIPSVLSAQSLEELQRVLQKELDSIAKVLMNEEYTVLPPIYKEPVKYAEGHVYNFAAGISLRGSEKLTDAGLHIYREGEWRLLCGSKNEPEPEVEPEPEPEVEPDPFEGAPKWVKCIVHEQVGGEQFWAALPIPGKPFGIQSLETGEITVVDSNHPYSEANIVLLRPE